MWYVSDFRGGHRDVGAMTHADLVVHLSLVDEGDYELQPFLATSASRLLQRGNEEASSGWIVSWSWIAFCVRTTRREGIIQFASIPIIVIFSRSCR